MPRVARITSDNVDEFGVVHPTFERQLVTVPTGNSRHIGHVREGRVAGDAFSRRNRNSIPVDHDVLDERRLAERTTVKKGAKLLKGVGKSQGSDDKAVRQAGGPANLPGEGGSVRQGKVNRGAGQQRLLEGDASGESIAQAAKARKVTKKTAKGRA